MHLTLATALFSLLPFSLAVNIPITVGDDKLAFNPSVVTTNVGDTLTFSYYPRNHSVAQSSFADPCHPLGSGGFFSGFQPLSAGPGPVEFVVQVNDTNPIWIYCSQTKGSHCQNGMAMVANQPASPSPDTLDAYKLAAAKANTSSSPSHVAGGIFVSRNSTSTTGRNSTASSTGSSSGPSSVSSSNSSSIASGSGTGVSGSGIGLGNGNGSSSGGSSGSGSRTESGSGSGTVSSSTTGGTSPPSPLSFKGAGSKTKIGVIKASVVCGVALILVFSLV
ncbi:MAG: hypothetical protein ASARMPREDX12_004087 [Alectoria sarmentosa]|nr:MAG: hypothetical protein ASARMPREDX12_004087 [Alectoria sarmentosa]